MERGENFISFGSNLENQRQYQTGTDVAVIRNKTQKNQPGDRAMTIIMILSLMLSAGAALVLLRMLWPE